MALKKCKECGEKVADSAKTCPHCGVSDPTVTLRDKVLGGLLAVIVIGGVVSYLSGEQSGSGQNQNTTTDGKSDPCTSEWQKCDDTKDLVNNYGDISRAQASCKTEAERRAKYGEPEFPWLSFSSYFPEENAVESGKVTLIEDEAKFENEYGAMAKVEVECVYDLESESVVRLTVRRP